MFSAGRCGIWINQRLPIWRCAFWKNGVPRVDDPATGQASEYSRAQCGKETKGINQPRSHHEKAAIYKWMKRAHQRERVQLSAPTNRFHVASHQKEMSQWGKRTCSIIEHKPAAIDWIFHSLSDVKCLYPAAHHTAHRSVYNQSGAWPRHRVCFSARSPIALSFDVDVSIIIVVIIAHAQLPV